MGQRRRFVGTCRGGTDGALFFFRFGGFLYIIHRNSVCVLFACVCLVDWFCCKRHESCSLFCAPIR